MRVIVLIFACMAVSRLAWSQTSQPANDWENISDPIVKSITASGTKIPWPGQTAGVCVDRATGRVIMDVTGIGLYTSDDHGDHFTPLATGQISGRCEYGFAFNADPAGNRLACFMLDGKCGLTLDAGKTWSSFAQVGRNWDFGAVDWSDPQAKSVFAIHHESGGEVYSSTDAGVTWKFLGKHPEFTSVGICGSHALLAGNGKGILRSTDDGKSWQQVSDLHPVGRVATVMNHVTYWLAKEGLITTRDDGATWHVQGSPIDAAWGPIFGPDEKEIVVANVRQVLRSRDAGQTWDVLATLPDFKQMPPHQPGQFLSIGWDCRDHYLYASRMANPTYRLKLKD